MTIGDPLLPPKVPKPEITGVEVNSCDADECSFYIYFESPPLDVPVEVTAYIRRHDRTTWKGLTVGDPEFLSGDKMRISSQCMQSAYKADTGKCYVKIMFESTDEFAPIVKKTSDPWTFQCGGGSAPNIDHVDIYFCDDDECRFHVYFNPPPIGATVHLFLNDTLVPSDPVAVAGGMYRVDGVCDCGRSFFIQLGFQVDDAFTWSDRVRCACVLDGGIIEVAHRQAPKIRDVDVYFCDDAECHFHVYFDTPPDGTVVKSYIDGALVSSDHRDVDDGWSRVALQHLKGDIITVQLAFYVGVLPAVRSPGLVIECALAQGVNVDLESVRSSNVKAAGWVRWLESHGQESPYREDSTGQAKIMELSKQEIGKLLSIGEMSEEEAEERLTRLGYAPADVDYLIILNSPD